MIQTLYNGVKLYPERYCIDTKNIERLDMGALPMIYRMARRGLQVDLSHFAMMDIELTRDMDKSIENIRTMTGKYINPGSGDQVAKLLFKDLGLKQAKEKLTASGSRESVDDDVLTAIQHQHPVVGEVLDYKEYEKLRGTYVRPMPKLARRTAFGKWRMFPNFKVTRVSSGRLACADPNLLAMPSRTERGRLVKDGFITDEGWIIGSVDESQIEVRLTAHRSRDPRLCNVYRNQEDIYSDFATASFALADKRYRDENGKWKYPTVDKNDHRFPAKTCVLASIYRVTAGGLQDQMPVICDTCKKPTTCAKCRDRKPHKQPEECHKHDCKHFVPMWIETKCQTLINQFYTRYYELVRMQVDDDRYMRDHAYMVDMWGRPLHVQAVRSVLEWVVSGAMREGGNHPCQSGAQGTVKLTMAAVNDDLENAGWYGDVVYPLLQVHDELLMECREDVWDEVAALIKWRFETCCELEVPIEAGDAKARSWGSIPK